MKSNNYSAFSFLNQNRKINRNKVKELIQSIEHHGFIESRPILINEKNQIIDGQHRFMALQYLGLPVVFNIHKTNGNDDQLVLALNKNQLQWKLNDYIHLHAEKGIKFHNEVRSIDEKYKYGTSVCLELCYGSIPKPFDIRMGKNLPIWKMRYDVADFILSLKEIPYYKSSKFVRAVIVLFQKANDKQIEKVKKHMMSIPQQAMTSQYLAIFSNILNKNVPIGKHITL